MRMTHQLLVRQAKLSICYQHFIVIGHSDRAKGYQKDWIFLVHLIQMSSFDFKNNKQNELFQISDSIGACVY